MKRKGSTALGRFRNLRRMHYAMVPHPIKLFNRLTGEYGDEVTFQRYAYEIWLNDLRWEQPKTNLARLAKVQGEIDKSPGQWMEFEDSDWSILCDIIHTPGHVQGRPVLMMPLVQLQLGPIFEGAILEALTTDPRKTLPNGTTTSEASS
jgi:hypothetical protein